MKNFVYNKSTKTFSISRSYVYVDNHEIANNRTDSAVHVTDDPKRALDYLNDGSNDAQIVIFNDRRYADDFASALRSGEEDAANTIWERFSRYEGISDPEEFESKFVRNNRSFSNDADNEKLFWSSATARYVDYDGVEDWELYRYRVTEATRKEVNEQREKNKEIERTKSATTHPVYLKSFKNKADAEKEVSRLQRLR